MKLTPAEPRSTILPGLTPSQRGAVAEAEIAAAAARAGFVVLLPVCEGGRYDLAIDLEPALLRVQCKLARHLSGVLSVRVSTSRYTPQGYVRTSYTADEIDAVGVYSPELRRCFLIPVEDVAGRRAIHLRLDPSKNNQAERIKWARDYEFEAVLDRLRGRQILPRTPGGYTCSHQTRGYSSVGRASGWQPGGRRFEPD
jgi:hypothetical protein